MRERKDALDKLKQADPETLTLGKRIRLVRDNKTQAEFGKLIKKSQDAISVYEIGDIIPPLHILTRIAHIGNVTIEWLTYGPSGGAKKSEVVFRGRVIKPGSPEWRILSIMTDTRNEKLKDRIAEIVSSVIKIEKK